MPGLPAAPGVAEFDTLHDDPPRWQAAVAALAARLRPGQPVQALSGGTVLVAFVGAGEVLKLYPPFLADHQAFEAGMLQRLQGRLSLPTPALLAQGHAGGWPWTLMTRLPGTGLEHVWTALDEAQKCRVLRAIGELTAEVHACPVGEQATLAPRWRDFIAAQRVRCVQRQQRTGLPPHLLAQLPAFLDAGPVPEGPDVLLTGEYTPMNLLVDGDRLTGLYDFGDGLIGPAPYDWLGPLAFMAAGHAARCDAYFAGYGMAGWRAMRHDLLRLLLLHRYSHLKVQLALPDWERAPTFEALAERLWP